MARFYEHSGSYCPETDCFRRGRVKAAVPACEIHF